MLKVLYINNQEINFHFLDEANCWRANVLIGNDLIEIEIGFVFHKEDTVNWVHFESFFRFITEPNRLQTYVGETAELVLHLGKTVFRNSDATKKWEAQFSKSIYYNGGSSHYLFSLIYHFAHPTEGFGDESGNYLVDYESNNVQGVRRHQC